MSSRDCYSILRPITYFSQILGIFPWSLTGPVGGRRFTPTYGTLMYSSIVFLFMTISMLVLMQEAWTKSEQLNIVRITSLFGLFLQISIMVLYFASVVFARGQMANVINSLCAQDEALRNLGIRFDYAADFRRCCIRLGVIVSIFFVLWGCNFVYYLEVNMQKPFAWLVWMLTNLIRTSGTCLIVEIILYSKRKFIALNKYVLKMIQDSEDSALQTGSIRYRTCARLRSIAMIHESLCESTSKLNQIFNVYIIAVFAHAFLFLTCSLYYIGNELTNPKISYFRIASYVNWVLFTSVDMLYMVLVCDMAKNEATQTGKLIHKLTVHEPDTALNIVIQNFSLQLHHGKLVFSAAGLFPLDATLIQSIVGAVTTYLVIFIQFNKAEP